MGKSTKIALSLVCIGFVCLSGYFIGSGLYKKPAADTENRSSAPPKENLYILENHSYKAGYPTVGPLTTTLPAQFNYENQTIEISEKISDVVIGNAVILHNNDGSIYLNKARIASIEPDLNTAHAIATLTLERPIDAFSLSNKALIITMETSGVKRLPLTALKSDEAGNHFVWRAVPHKTGKLAPLTITAPVIEYKIDPLPTEVFLQDARFFEAGYAVSPADLFILNPDDKLKPQTIVSALEITDIGAPTKGMYYDAWMQNAIQRSNQRLVDVLQKAEACLANAKAIVDAPVKTGDQSNPAGNCNQQQPADPNNNTPGGASYPPGKGGCGGTAPAKPVPSGTITSKTMVNPYVLLGIKPYTKEELEILPKSKAVPVAQ